MKFKDVRTLESVLTEYGMKPGASTPTSQQQTGSNAKANAVKSPTVNKKTPPKKDLGSPTTTPGLDVKEPEQEQPKFTPIKAGEIEGDEGCFVGATLARPAFRGSTYLLTVALMQAT